MCSGAGVQGLPPLYGMGPPGLAPKLMKMIKNYWFSYLFYETPMVS